MATPVLAWNVYGVSVAVGSIAAGLPAKRPVVKLVVERNQPGEREFNHRTAIGELMPSNEEVVNNLMEVLGGESEGTEQQEELARFRRCKEHGAIYVPRTYPYAVLQDGANVTTPQLGITLDQIRSSTQIWPQVIHITRDGALLTEPDAIVALYGSVTASTPPFRRSIEQFCELVVGVKLDFTVFVVAEARGAKRRGTPTITAEQIRDILWSRANAFSPHRKMDFGEVLEVDVVDHGTYRGHPALYLDANVEKGMRWEMEDILHALMQDARYSVGVELQ